MYLYLYLFLPTIHKETRIWTLTNRILHSLFFFWYLSQCYESAFGFVFLYGDSGWMNTVGIEYSTYFRRLGISIALSIVHPE